MHTIKPLAAVTPAEVQALAQAAAERGEPLDECNVFPLGSSSRAIFTTQYLDRLFELEDCDADGAIFEDFDILVLDLPCHPAGQCVGNVNPRIS